MSYTRIKWIKGHPYLYVQSSYRVGSRVKTKYIRYIGRFGYGSYQRQGIAGFIPPAGLTPERHAYVDKEIAKLKQGTAYQYEREILRQFLYHHNFRFIGASRRRTAWGYVMRQVGGNVIEFGVQSTSGNFTWMHELGHALEFQDKIVTEEIRHLREKFIESIAIAYVGALYGGLAEKEAFITQYAPLIDIRTSMKNGASQPLRLEERAIYQRLMQTKEGIIPESAFTRVFQAWVNAGYRITEAEILADSVAALIIHPELAFETHGEAARPYLSRLYIALHTHLEEKYQISLGKPKRKEKIDTPGVS